MHCEPVELSERERQIVRLRVRGLAYKQIAAELAISINTVKTHLGRIFVKLDIQCSLDLLRKTQCSECERCGFNHVATSPLVKHLPRRGAAAHQRPTLVRLA